jgi:hypothetical protein
MAGTNAQYIGSGFLGLQDAAGNAYQCGVLQKVSFDFASETAKLFGSKKAAILRAETGVDYKISAEFAQLSSPLVAAVLGGVRTSGSNFVATTRKTTASGAATIATTDVGSPSGWAFVSDLGVTYATTGQPFTYNSGTPAAGEYKNSGAAYTFAGAEDGASVDISYVYSVTAGTKYTISNADVGLSTYFKVWAAQQTTQADGTVRKMAWYFPAVLLPSIKIPFGTKEFTVQSIEMECCPDASGVIATYTVL